MEAPTIEQLKKELRAQLNTRFEQMKTDPGYLAHENVNRLNGDLDEWLAAVGAATTTQQVVQTAYWWDAELDLAKVTERHIKRDALLEYARLSMVEEVGKEYVTECEHQDGEEYWDVFDELQQIYDDFVTYLTYVKMHSGEQ